MGSTQVGRCSPGLGVADSGRDTEGGSIYSYERRTNRIRIPRLWLGASEDCARLSPKDADADSGLLVLCVYLWR